MCLHTGAQFQKLILKRDLVFRLSSLMWENLMNKFELCPHPLTGKHLRVSNRGIAPYALATNETGTHIIWFIQLQEL